MSVGNLGDPLESADIVQGEAERLTGRQHLTLSVLWFALNLQSAALLPIVLPVQILPIVAPGEVGSTQQAAILSILSTVSALIAMAAPLAGALSDRTTSVWGRRRPYIMAGALLLLLGASVLATPRRVAFLLAGLVLFQLGGTVCTAGYLGLLPDLVPQAQRGEASGYIGLMTILGNVCSLGIAALLLGQVTSGAATGTIHRGVLVYYTLTGL